MSGKPMVHKSRAYGFWFISYGPHLHQNMFSTWQRAYDEAQRLAGKRTNH